MKKKLILFLFIVYFISFSAHAEVQYYLGNYSGNTGLLLHMNGSNGGKIFTDETGKIVIPYGDTSTSTSIKYLGNASAHFDGNNDYIDIIDSDDWKFGTEDFTVAFWFYAIDFNNHLQFGCVQGWVTNGWYVDIANTLVTAYTYNSGSYSYAQSSQTININEWNNVEFTSKDGILKIYVNGIEGFKNASNNLPTSWTPSANLTLGRRPDGSLSNFFNGYVDEMSIFKGVSIPITEIYPQSHEIQTVLPPISTFSLNPTSGHEPLAVQFIDTSYYGGNFWEWSATNVIGNNTPFIFSTEQNPNQIFNYGDYLIKLNSTNSAGNNISYQKSWVNVTKSIATEIVVTNPYYIVYFWERIA